MVAYHITLDFTHSYYRSSYLSTMSTVTVMRPRWRISFGIAVALRRQCDHQNVCVAEHFTERGATTPNVFCQLVELHGWNVQAIRIRYACEISCFLIHWVQLRKLRCNFNCWFGHKYKIETKRKIRFFTKKIPLILPDINLAQTIDYVPLFYSLRKRRNGVFFESSFCIPKTENDLPIIRNSMVIFLSILFFLDTFEKNRTVTN